MSLKKTYIDKAEVPCQFKANDQEKVFIGKIDIFSQFGYSRKRSLGKRKSSTTCFLSIHRESGKIISTLSYGEKREYNNYYIITSILNEGYVL